MQHEMQQPSPIVQTSKHTDMYHAIQEINAVTAELQALLDRITGPRPKEDEAKAPPIDPTPPSLSDFLGGGADDIRRKVEVAAGTIARITQELF
jgi:hypothetical protein